MIFPPGSYYHDVQSNEGEWGSLSILNHEIDSAGGVTKGAPGFEVECHDLVYALNGGRGMSILD